MAVGRDESDPGRDRHKAKQQQKHAPAKKVTNVADGHTGNVCKRRAVEILDNRTLMFKHTPIALALVAVCASTTLAQTQGMFVYQNNFWLNLHQFLRGEIFRRSAPRPLGIDPATLNGADRKAWASAIAVYEEVGKLDLFDQTSMRISNTLAMTKDEAQLREGLLDARTTAALNAAAPIFRAKLWDARRRENDAWNAAAKALTDRHQDAMAAALAKAYGITWPREQYLVDAVGETGPNSGFAHGAPDGFAAHIHASVGSVRNTGNAPLELLFHEASHVPAVNGRIRRMIEEECARQKLDVPRELDHFMIMFTTGELTRHELARTGSPGYEPYVYRYNQLPPAVLSAFERNWRPYLEGQTPLETALRDLVRNAR
jgi:hypothetical protein